MAKKSASKLAAKKSVASKKAAKSAASKKKSGGKKVAKKSARGKSAEPKLGRPTVTGEEMLFMLFKEDYHARQVFDFLRVQTVKELEQFSPQQIVKILSRPITETVNRIRRKLAEKNRYLLDDVSFAFELKQQS